MPKSNKIQYTFPNGEVIDLFYIGALALSLGRSVPTIRKWEIAGIIPATCFKDSMGCRLYSQEQIDIITDVATEETIAQGKPISRTNFTSKCEKRLSELMQKYKQKNEVNSNAVEHSEETTVG